MKEKMKCLVTGGAGFIGSHLVDRLIELGHEVAVIDNLSTGKRKYVNKKANFIRGDINNVDYPHLVGFDFVFHCAALPRVHVSISRPIDTHMANVDGTLNMLYRAAKNRVGRFIYSSSSSVYGDQETMPISESALCKPKSPYALQKYIGELYCEQFSRHFGLDTVSLRYFNVYGARMPQEGAYKLVVTIFQQQKKKGEPLTVFGDGTQTRDFTHVSDVVEANIKAMECPKKLSAEVINIGTGVETSVNKIADLIGGEKKYITPNPRGKFEEMRKAAAIGKAKTLLKWEPEILIEENWHDSRLF